MQRFGNTQVVGRESKMADYEDTATPRHTKENLEM